jgi:hypothetical protein
MHTAVLVRPHVKGHISDVVLTVECIHRHRALSLQVPMICSSLHRLFISASPLKKATELKG